MNSFVDIENVTLNYRGASGNITALQNTTLKVGRGEFAAVVGPSGCGKSTLMRLVTGLHKPTAGTIAIDGKEVKGPVKMAGMAFQRELETAQKLAEEAEARRQAEEQHVQEAEARAREQSKSARRPQLQAFIPTLALPFNNSYIFRQSRRRIHIY